METGQVHRPVEGVMSEDRLGKWLESQLQATSASTRPRSRELIRAAANGSRKLQQPDTQEAFLMHRIHGKSRASCATPLSSAEVDQASDLVQPQQYKPSITSDPPTPEYVDGDRQSLC